MTLISHEVPKTLFPIHDLISDYPYVLGHLLNQDQEYERFYAQKIVDSNFSILDNSCFELGKSISNSEFSALIHTYNPTYYILPDVLHNKKETLSRSKDFLQYREAFLVSKPMGVLQGKNVQELIDCYDWYIENDVNYIALPFHLILDGDYSVARYLVFNRLFSSMVKNRVHVHFLGVGNPAELLLYSSEQKQLITSIDTSSPIVLGWKGVRYGEYGYNCEKPKEKLAENLDIELSPGQIQDIIFNVKKFKGYLC